MERQRPDLRIADMSPRKDDEYEVEEIGQEPSVKIDEKRIADLRFDRVPTRDLEVEEIEEAAGEKGNDEDVAEEAA